MNEKKRVEIGAKREKRTTAKVFLDLNYRFSETEAVYLQEKSSMEIKNPITVSIFLSLLGLLPLFLSASPHGPYMCSQSLDSREN